MMRRMEFHGLGSRDLDGVTLRKLAVLLGRAYTDARHVDAYSEADRALWGPAIERVHAAAPAPGELMPEAFLKRFPTWRNGQRPAAERRQAWHFVADTGEYFAGHVSLWAQHFVFGDEEVSGGYIEDVATDPLHLGGRLAMHLMVTAQDRARELGLGLLGLATGLRGYYERLGWEPWTGDHVFHVAERNAAYPDQPLYLLPLSEAGERMARGTGTMKSWRLARFEDPRPG